jgi:diguanylate cyclase (GGDEF)-like protein
VTARTESNAVEQHDLVATELDSSSFRLLAVLSIAVGCIALTTACAVLIGGWIMGVDTLKRVVPGFNTMKVNTAISIACLGAALAVTHADRRYRGIANAAASVAVVIALLTLAEYVFLWDAGIDQLWTQNVATPPGTDPGRPAAATAVMITLLGAAILCTGHPKLARVKTVAGSIVLVTSWAALNGYIFGPWALQEVPLLRSIALHTAILMLLLSLGTLAAEPASRPIRTVLARSTGGVICRWLLPTAILAPPLLGWFLTRGGALDVFPNQFDWALYSAISTLGSGWLILTLAHRITVIDAARLSAAELARHDPLTGLTNRRAFDAFLLESFNLSRRHGHALALLLIDIDHFKSYNDAFGHPAGDALLKELSVILSSLARETDLVARLGGEEFGIVLPETDAGGARVFAERVRTEVEQATQFKRALTVSVGVAALSDEIGTPSELIEDCDSALYQAKSGGRNLVCANGTCFRSAGAARVPT